MKEVKLKGTTVENFLMLSDRSWAESSWYYTIPFT
jgi:hypothetical protein